MKRIATMAALLVCAGCGLSSRSEVGSADDATTAVASPTASDPATPDSPASDPASGGPPVPNTRSNPGSPAPPGAASAQRIQISVSDTAFRAVTGARVEVLDGPSAGLFATVDASGYGYLDGTFASITQLRATMDGHVPVTRAYTTVDPRLWASFTLESVVPPVDVAGTYNLTLIADSACTGIPDELRTRTYSATLTWGRWSSLDIAVGGASLVEKAAYAPYGGVAGDYVSLGFGACDAAGIVEQLGPSTYLAIDGYADASAVTHGGTITTSFDGYIDVCALASPLSNVYIGCGAGGETIVSSARCQSNKHTMILTPVTP